MFKILLDATPVSPYPSGVGLYITNLIKGLASLAYSEDFKLEVIYQPSFKDWVKRKVNLPNELIYITQDLPVYNFALPIKVSNVISSLNLFKWFSLQDKIGNPHVIHGNSYTVLRCPESIKVLTIYDLTFIKYPQYVNRKVLGYKNRVRQALKWTDIVVTISENSKKDIVEYLGVKPDRIYVTPLASRYSQFDLSSLDESKLCSHVNYNFSQPYLLFVSTIEPRKNILTLIQAFNQVKERKKISHNLVLIGRKGWQYELIFQMIASSPYQKSIHYFDYLSDQLVAFFYSKAEVFVYPSHYEGFGLPVLEAMTLSCPVISSCNSSLPEVGGNAILYINPNDTEELADRIWQVINDRSLRSELVKRGLYQATLFSWEKTARATLEMYQIANSCHY